jgi:DNA-directed RNA polymerase subunit RPC12/RpoP
MDTPISATALNCTQCGGELHPEQGQLFLTCPYCSATVYLDKSRVVFHWSLAPTLDENQALGALARWMAGNQTVKDLDKKARLVGTAFQYFPVWYLKYKRQGQEHISLEPAAAASVSELRHLPLTAGDLRRYEPSLEPQSQSPTVPLEAAQSWLKQSQDGAEIVENSLVHIPIFTMKYVYQNRTYTAIVEAASGKTMATIYPAKSEAPYLLAGSITALVYLCLATAPLIGWASGSSSGLTIGLAILIGGGLLAAPFLFALAAWVAAKI